MRPEEKRPNKFQTGKSRARMLLKKNAAWLPGFPLATTGGAVAWQAWPWEKPGDIWSTPVDRNGLRRAELAISKLRHRFPNALPRIVEDVDDWLTRMACLLELLKGAIHADKTMDVEALFDAPCTNARWSEAFRRARRRYGQLAPLIDALAFVQFTGRSCCDASVLSWVEDHASRLQGLETDNWEARDLQLAVCTLREDLHAELLPILFGVLGEPASYWVPADEIGRYAEELNDELKKALNGESFAFAWGKPGRPTMGAYWQELLRRLLAMDSKARRSATALLGKLLPTNLSTTTRVLRDTRKEQETRLRTLLHRFQHSDWRPHSKAESKQVFEEDRITIDIASIQLLEWAAFALKHVPEIAEDSTRCRQWIQFVDCLPDDERVLRLGLFCKWERDRSHVYSRASASHTFGQVLPTLCRILNRRGLHPSLLQHWRAYVAPNERRRDELVSCLLSHRRYSQDMIRRWGRLLELTVYDHNLPLGAEMLSSLEDFVGATKDTELAARLVVALAACEDDYYSEDAIRATLAIASDDSRFVPLMEKIDGDYEIQEAVTTLEKHLRSDWIRKIIEQLVVTGSKKQLLRLASCTRAVIGLGADVPFPADVEGTPNWFERYPSELHAALRDLQAAAPEAEAIAAGILRRDFPDPDGVRHELDVIRLKLSSETFEPGTRDRLERRRDNLQKRLDQPQLPTPQRLGNLARKISDRACHEMIERYVRTCHAIAGEKLRATWHVESSMGEVLEPPRDEILTGILGLNGATRELGLKLFFGSLKDPQLDFRDEPENVEFLAGIRARGIELGPWLKDTFERTAKTASGEPYRLFFSREVIDVLLMGSRFDTCLSVGSMNFFSTIANAVDINKQVVYGKTGSGRIVGRCLFVLADNGAILTYHRYAHDGADRFDVEVNRFADELAGAMNTVLTTSGRVSKLVARRWYDDGAVSSESIYDLQNPEGAVRTLLRTGDPSILCRKLSEILGSENALRSLLGSLLSLEEFTNRPEIVEPFLECFGRDGALPFMEGYRLAILGKAAGLGDSAREIVHDMRITSIPYRLKRFACWECSFFHGLGSCREVIGLLLDCNPSIALRALRQTRPRGVKSDEQETDPARKEMLERCHRALGRGD